MVSVDYDPRLLSADIRLPDELLQFELAPNMKLVHEMPKKSVLAMSTFYRPRDDGTWDPVIQMRAQLALNSIVLAKDAGYRVLCVDEFSDAGWRTEARDRGADVRDPDFEKYSVGTSNMGRCRRQAIDLACQIDGRTIGIIIEPEKHPAVRAANGSLLLAMASTPIHEGLADFVIPRRADNGNSYPAVQQFMERAGNAVTQNLLFAYALQRKMAPEQAADFSQYLDHFFGAKMFRIGDNEKHFRDYAALAQEDSKFNDQWGSVHYPPIMALLAGRTVRGVAIDYKHPQEQTAMEGRNLRMDMKRYEQGTQLTQTLALLLNRDLKARGLAELVI